MPVSKEINIIFDSYSGFGTGFAGALLNNVCYAAWSFYRTELHNCKYYYNMILIQSDICNCKHIVQLLLSNADDRDKIILWSTKYSQFLKKLNEKFQLKKAVMFFHIFHLKNRNKQQKQKI